MIGNLTGHSWSFLLSCIAAVYVVLKLLLGFRAYGKRQRSIEWPMIIGTFQSGAIEPFRSGTVGEFINFRLKVKFSYCADGSTYHGVYSRDFPTENEATHLQRSLQQGPLYVRYKPISHDDSVLDPYRDVWQPTASAPGGSVAPLTSSVPVAESGAPGMQTPKIGKNYWWTAPVSLGKLLLSQLFLAILLAADSKPNRSFFWFIAGLYSVKAITTKGCCWWGPAGRTLPTWVGRLVLIAVACAWILASIHFAH